MRTVALLLFTACASATVPPVEGEPPCVVSDEAVTCAPREVTVDGRRVFWQQPLGEAPAGGRPVVLVFQGSFIAPTATWNRVPRDAAFGGYQQARLQALLLENGFVVIAPFAEGIAWQTNTSTDFTNSTDKRFIDALLAEIDAGTFGAIDTSRRYATGISSGGYMTSRMALTWPGMFRALVIASASWATCGGVVCALPPTLPVDHPPTRLLHGRGDLTVPLFTAQAYFDALVADGIEAELLVDEALGHAWGKDAPEQTLAWFTTH
ncbi:MAG: hypothetical protein ACO1OB_01085 [Archangium sp.]